MMGWIEAMRRDVCNLVDWPRAVTWHMIMGVIIMDLPNKYSVSITYLNVSQNILIISEFVETLSGTKINSVIL